MQMIIIDRQLYPWKDISNPALNEKKKEKGENEARASIPNPVKLFLAIALMLKTCFNVGNNLTPNNAYNILSDFLCSLMKIRTTNKTKEIMVLVAMQSIKLTMVLLLQIIIYKEVKSPLFIYIYIFNNTNCVKATAHYQNRNIVSII